MEYNVRHIESKWQDRWEEEPIGLARPAGSGKKFYCLDMFPYPSGSGLHVGHWRGYVLSDVYARRKWLEGYNVLHPMGWDAFGLPAENDALKRGIHPRVSTQRNIEVFKRQLKQVAAIYDWSKEINTTDPAYYKWTQWIFLQMYHAGLAYQDHVPINWCPSCLTGLANEEVENGRCERCGTKVEPKHIRQWMLRISNYADRLLSGLDKVEWPEKVKAMQRNWIGKSEGVEITFKVAPECASASHQPTFTTFTTRPETIYGVTFVVFSPDHPLLDTIVPSEYKASVAQYRRDIQNDAEQQEKTGIFTGGYAVHPLTNERIPIFVANFVVSEYGTGAVMGVPAHDERDYDFAKAVGIDIRHVVQNPEGDTSDNVYTGDGVLINSGIFDGLQAKTDGRTKVTQHLEEKGIGQKTTQYRLRDWVFSRQRYWGEPIPIVHCQECGTVPVPEDQLPIELPEVERYEPTGTGESPLAAITDWVNTTCPVCDAPAKRETNTMPQWAGSCWYFLRYPCADMQEKPFDYDVLKYWLPVDLYVGGIEHAILHLLYARFYIKVLYDLGYVPYDEPFWELYNQGMITRYSEKTGMVEKMSKSKGNVVAPDDMVTQYGSDALRLYILFMGPPEMDSEWKDSGIEGTKRFLQRMWNFLTARDRILAEGEEEDLAVKKRWHRCVKDVIERLDMFKPNTAISALMEWLNDAYSNNIRLHRSTIEDLLVILSTMAPHIASELLEQLCGKQLQACTWPTYDPALARQETVTVAIQVNGKTRSSVQIASDAQQEDVEERARKEVAKWLVNKQIARTIYVPGKLLNFVVRE